MVYFCTWGAKCELLHDLADEILSDPNNEKEFAKYQNEKSIIMSTWHNNETLADALWFALYNAVPADDYIEQTKNLIVIIMDNDDLYPEVKDYLLNVDKLNKDVTG